MSFVTLWFIGKNHWGLCDDADAGRTRRQVSIIERETLDEFGLPIGDVRENIMGQGIQLGGKIKVGATLQITD